LANIEAIKPLVETEAVKPLTTLLTHSNYGIRRNAGWALSQLDNSKSTELLTDMLTDKDLKDRFGAIGALNQWESVEALPKIMEVVKQNKNIDNVVLRTDTPLIAVEALYSLDGALAVRTLVENLGSEEQQSLTINILGQLGSVEAVKPLLELLKHESFSVRSSAAEALGKLDSVEAIPALLNLLKEKDEKKKDEEVYGIATEKNYRLKKAYFRAGKKFDAFTVGEEPDAIILALEKLNSPDLEELLLAWLKDPHSSKRRYAAEKLATLGNVKAIPLLKALLQDPVATVRESAVKALGQLEVKEVIPLLIPLLDDPFSSVREDVVTALGQLNNVESVPRFIALLKDPYSAVRQSAARTLGQLKQTQAFPALLELLHDPEETVQSEVITVLGQLGQADALPHLLPLLQDKHEEIRSSAAQALGELGSSQAMQPLLTLLQDKKAKVRSSAATALGQLSKITETKEAIQPLTQFLTDYRDVDVRKSAAAALTQLDPANAEKYLGQLLKDPDSQVIQYALEKLDALDSLKTVKPLVELLLYQESPNSSLSPEDTMYNRVTKALGTLGLVKPDLARQDRQLQRLQTQATRLNPQQRQAAAKELGQILSAQSVQLLLSLLKDSHTEVKQQVLLSLKRLGEIQPHLILPARPALQTLARDTQSDKEKTSLVQKVLQQIDSVTPQTPDTNLALEQLKQIALNPKERLTNRSSAIKLLGKLGTADVANTLMIVANNLMTEVKTEAKVKQSEAKPTTAPLLLFATYRALGNTTSPQTTLPVLQEQLKQLAAHKQTWREVGRNKRWNYSQSELELGYAIARLDIGSGIKLLSHDLAQVRKGAELALGRLVTVDLLRTLTDRRHSKPSAGLSDAFFQEASLQTIDNLLTTLADKGGAKELVALEKWLPSVPDEAVKERVAWTVEKLKSQLETK
jgi:HEAT repeat protein